MKRALVVTALFIAATVAACDDDGIAPPTTGTISLQIIAMPEPAPPAASAAAAQDVIPVRGIQPGRRAADSTRDTELRERWAGADRPRGKQAEESKEDPGPTPAATHREESDLAEAVPRPAFDVAGHLEAARVTVSGPTNKSINLTAGPTGFTGTVDGLAPGLYAVAVEGLVGGEADYFGVTSDVQVTAGQNTTTTISFASFRPVVTASVSPTTPMIINVSFPAVPNAESYEVDLDIDPAFPSPTTSSITGTSTDLTVVIAGTYYVQARAVNALVTAARASDAVMVQIDPGPPAQLAFRTVPSSSARTTFTAEVEIQDSFGNLVVTATDNVTLDFSNNVGSMLLHSSGRTSPILEPLDPVSPTILATLPNTTTMEIRGMTYDPATATVLAVDFSNLIAIDPVTGTETTIGPLNIQPFIQGVAFEPSTGRLIGAEHGAFGANLYEVDPATGNQTLIGVPVLDGGADVLYGYQSMATDPITGTMYASAWLQSSGACCPGLPRHLVTVDPTALTATTIGQLVGPSGTTAIAAAGLAFLDDGTLLAVSGDGTSQPDPNPETLFVVDKATGAMTPLLPLGNGDSGEELAAIPAALSGTLTRAAIGGVATFNDLQIDAPAMGYELVATGTGLAASFSGPFNVNPGVPTTPGPPAQLAFRTVSNQIARTSFTTVEVEIQDAAGNLVPIARHAITLAIGTDPNGGATTLSGSLTASAVSGVASFGNLSVDLSGPGFSLTGTSGPLTSAASASFDVDPRVIILSNSSFDNGVVLDSFSVNMPNIAFDTMNVIAATPSPAFLSNFNVVLLSENGNFANATSVGDTVEIYVQGGGNVVIGTFYWQDRSDNITGNGWGNLEMIDPFTGPTGSEYNPDNLDPASVVSHPLTAGVSSLSVQSYHGGVTAKVDAVVLATWSDGVPLIGYRTEASGQRLVAVSTWPVPAGTA